MMKKFLNKVFIIVILISLTGCSKTADETSVPVLSHTTAEAVRAVLHEEIKGEITILGYDSNSALLSKAKSILRKKYPECDVKIEKFQPLPEYKDVQSDDGTVTTIKIVPDEEQKKRDYINRINTEFMGGGGADILLIDNIIPWYRYADYGYLEDLRVYMEQDAGFNTQDYRMNIINGTEYKGGVYAFPISVNFRFFAYDASRFNDEEQEALSYKNAFTFEELINISSAAFERNGMESNIFGYTGGKYPDDFHIFNCLIDEYYTSFVDFANKKARFNDGRFEKLLLTITDYCKKGYIKEVSEINETYQSAILTLPYPNPNPDEHFFFKHEPLISLLLLYDKNLPGIPLYLPTYGNDDNDVFAGLIADCNGNIPFKPVDMYAINGNSKNKRVAWEFIKILVSDEIQSEFEVYGVPVNRSVLEEREMTDLTVGGLKTSKLNDDNRLVFEEYLVFLDSLIDEVNTCILRNDKIDGWIKEEAALYFDGKKSAKAVAKVLQNKVRLYLNE